mgnify:CR=1 FL=1
MTLQQIRYVTMIAQAGSMNEAAKKLFISQPSLSGAIKELEKEVGIIIFSRTSKGVVLTAEGEEFLGYARQILNQVELLEEKYLEGNNVKKKFGVSTQHYSFAVKAFVEMVKAFDMDEYEFAIRETKTADVIRDVSTDKSQIGILYLNDFNRTVLEKLIKEHDLVFTELFVAKPHIFVSTKNPLAGKKSVTIEELEPYPYLSFEQGEHNSFYFSEEIFSTVDRPKNIRVRDRATLFNLLIGLNGYTVCSGVIDEELNGENIVAVPLEAQGDMHIGTVTHKKVLPSRLGAIYRDCLLYTSPSPRDA